MCGIALEKEASDNTALNSLQARLKDVQNRIKNIVSAIEQGIITSTTKDRLTALEDEQANLETAIAKEQVKKPQLKREGAVRWLQSFKNGDKGSPEYRRTLVDTFVNSVFLYDDGNDGDKKLVITYNISGDNKSTLKCSDIEAVARPINR